MLVVDMISDLVLNSLELLNSRTEAHADHLRWTTKVTILPTKAVTLAYTAAADANCLLKSENHCAGVAIIA